MPTNFTPLTTRPLSTSRQGMMRLARPMLILSQLIRELLRLDEVETAFVQRADVHPAHHAVAIDVRVHDRLHTLALETLRDVYDVMILIHREDGDRHLAAFR